ncbi:MAG: type II secretion system protein [Planctomycetota bacterium]|jgi:prepilin-type N-terminal cleavage/methylation domain-containing protein
MNRHVRGFTLIEVLVVVSILGVLMALVSVLVIRAGAHKERMQTEQLVTAYLPQAIMRYQQEFKRLPPMSIKELNQIGRYKGLAITDNSTNECNEALLVALRHGDFSTPLGETDLPTEDPFGNTDEDMWNQAPNGFGGNPNALEILDAWGNPIIYIHKNQYNEVVRIILKTGEEVEIEARKRDDDTYYNPTSFQLISLGENGVLDIDVDDPDLVDDIMNFTIRSSEE